MVEIPILKEHETYLDPIMSNWMVEIKDKLRNKWDMVILFTGRKGVGKSTLAILILKLIDYKFNHLRIAYTPEEIIPILKTLEPYQSVLLDEGAESWASLDYATRVSKTLNKTFIGNRWLYAAYGICAPTIHDLDKRAISLADYWIKVYSPDDVSRGYAEVRKMGEKDYKDMKLPFAPEIFEIEFDDLPPKVARKYERFKAEKGSMRLDAYDEVIKREVHGYKQDWISTRDVITAVKRNPEKFKNKLERFDKNLIWTKFSKKRLGADRAQAIAAMLNKERDAGGGGND